MTADELKAWAKKAILSEAETIEYRLVCGNTNPLGNAAARTTLQEIEGLIAKHKVLTKLAAHVDVMSVIVVDKAVEP